MENRRSERERRREIETETERGRGCMKGSERNQGQDPALF